MNVRAATVDDAAACAALHVECIPTGFLSRLGPAFLTRLYRRAVRDPGSFVLVTGEDGDVDGFVAVALDVGRFYRAFLLRDGAVAAFVALPRLVRHVRQAVETLRYPGANDGELPAAELLAIAVAPRARGAGAGGALLARVGDELARRGVRAIRTVVGLPNEPALAAYRRAGYRSVERIEVHRGAPSEVLVWTAPSQ